MYLRFLFLIFLSFSLPIYGDSPELLYFKDLVPLKRKSTGYNSGGIYTLQSNPKQIVHVKGFSADNALVVSLLMSRLLALICPGHGPHVVPLKTDKGFMIASYDIPNFKNGSDPSDKSFILVNLVLDFMNILDLHEANIGTATVNGKKDTVVVDIDRYLEDRAANWFEKIENYVGHKKNFEYGLSVIASASDEKIRTTFNQGVQDLKKIMMLPSLDPLLKTELVFKRIMHRKKQMEWVYKNFDIVGMIPHETECEHNTRNESVADCLERIKNERKNFEEKLWVRLKDFKDDRFGYFLRKTIVEDKQEIFQRLLQNGAKDPEGLALWEAVRKNKMEMYNALLAHGAKDMYHKSLLFAISRKNYNLIRSILKNGIEIPTEKTFYTVIEYLIGLLGEEQEDISIVKVLFDHGFRDTSGKTLVLATIYERNDLIDILVDHGVKDLSGGALSAVSDAKLYAKLVQHGCRDPEGKGLNSAISMANLDMVKIAVESGSKIEDGWALELAVKKGGLEILNFLLKHGATDSNGRALKAARDQKKSEMIKILEDLHSPEHSLMEKEDL